MRSAHALVAIFLLLGVLSGLVAYLPHASGAAEPVLPTPTGGYVTYRLTLGSQGNSSENLVLNETARPITANGMVQVTLLLTGSGRHLEYSKILNSSSVPEILPYFIGLNNQSLSYFIRGFEVQAQIVQAGQTSVSFRGNTYSAENYAVGILATNSSDPTMSYHATGNIVVMPSSLIYSVNLQSSGQFSLTAQLVATNLPLTSIQQSPTNTVFGFALVGLGLLGAAAVAIPSLFAIVKVRMAKPKPLPASAAQPRTAVDEHDKPEYWVD